MNPRANSPADFCHDVSAGLLWACVTYPESIAASHALFHMPSQHSGRYECVGPKKSNLLQALFNGQMQFYRALAHQRYPCTSVCAHNMLNSRHIPAYQCMHMIGCLNGRQHSRAVLWLTEGSHASCFAILWKSVDTLHQQLGS